MQENFKNGVKEIILRELDNLFKEINLYSNEAELWKVSGQISNSAGNLCLHICGNLQHFIGAVLGNTDYQRNRDYEFSARGIKREELLAEIVKAKAAVAAGIDNVKAEVLLGNYPLPFQNQTVKTVSILIHLTAHLQYHLGQVNYHRRLLAS